jgi:hypothetical protein
VAVFAHLAPPKAKTIFQGDLDLNPKLEFYEALVQVPSNAPSGRYELLIGLYDPKTGLHVALKNGGGQTDTFRIRKALQVVRP